MKNSRVLITGVAGFIGSNLADRLLLEGYDVVGIDNLSYGRIELVPQGVDFHKCDIRDKEIYPLFQGVDVVFHLAAKNQLLDCQNDPVDTMSINVAGTANVFEAARHAGVRKVVYAESSVVEEGDDRTKGFYAISKMTCGWLADGYRTAYNLNITGLRYFNVYGQRQDYRRTIPPVMSAFVIKLLQGEAPTLYEGAENNKRDFIHVDDVNDFHIICISDDRTDNKVFRLGSGKNYSMIEILESVKRLMGSKIEPVIEPRQEHDVYAVTLADISEAAKLGWQPKTQLDDGIKNLIEHLQEEFASGRIKSIS